MFSLAKKHPRESLIEEVNYEDWGDEGYEDDVDLEIVTKGFYNSVRTAVAGDSTDLDQEALEMLAVDQGPFSSRRVNKWVAEQLFSPNRAS